MRDSPVLFLRKITEILPCSLDLRPSQQSFSSGDLLLEMMESGMPPPIVPPCEAGDPEVSSRRVSPNPAGPEGSHVAPKAIRVRSLKKAIERVRHRLVLGRMNCRIC